MKYLRMLGLAAVAALAMLAIAGAGTASATGGVLCEDTEEPCENKWAVDAHMTFALKANTKTLLTTTANATLLECAESKLTGKVLSAGTAAARAKLEVKKEWFTFGKCGADGKGPVPVTVTAGELEFTWRNEPETKGTVFAKKLVVTAEVLGVHCHYTFGAETHLGLYTPGAAGKDGIIAIKAILNRENSATHPSTFMCPATVFWDAEYTLTTDTALYIKGE